MLYFQLLTKYTIIDHWSLCSFDELLCWHNKTMQNFFAYFFTDLSEK